MIRYGQVVAALVAGIVSTPALAGNLDGVIRDLYGGDGIKLDDEADPADATDFVASSIAGIDGFASLFNRRVAESLNSSSLPPMMGSFTYDLSGGEAPYQRSTTTFGPIVGERADTVGVAKLNVGFNFKRQRFHRFQGMDLNDIRFISIADDDCPDGSDPPCAPGAQPSFGTPTKELTFLETQLNLDLRRDVLNLFANFGITDRWDVGILVPVVQSTLRARGFTRIDVSQDTGRPSQPPFLGFCSDPTLDTNPNPGGGVNFTGATCDGNEDRPASSTRSESWGVGDVLLRTKVHALEGTDQLPDLAVLSQVKLNTGDARNFHGTGNIDFSTFVIASMEVWRMTPHANLGVELTTGDSRLDNVQYVVGSDLRVFDRVSLALDVLGRHSLDPDGFGDDLFDISFGGKVNPWADIVFFGNAIWPLNDDEGLRSNITWSIGIEFLL